MDFLVEKVWSKNPPPSSVVKSTSKVGGGWVVRAFSMGDGSLGREF